MISCKRCIMSSDVVPTLTVDDVGVCTYCRHYDKLSHELGTLQERSAWIENKVAEIKRNGAKSRYDCLLGVSGGVDSSYLAYWLKSKGLRPLLVHFDNGWDSELATENIRNICERLDLPLETHVVNWEEFRELQLAYLRAGVIDIEAITDHAIMATVSKIAASHRIKYLISGFNVDTEAVMPRSWVWDKGDYENIKDIYRKFGSGRKLRTFPHVSFASKIWQYWIRKSETVQVLNYIGYRKSDAKATITNELGWRDYGGKHYESLFTKFYQAYILPVKFGVDKRYAHLSNLICSGQITREEALAELQKPLYTPGDLGREKSYVCKKLGLSEADFTSIMSGPVRPHNTFKTESEMWNRYFRMLRILKFRWRGK